MCLGYKNKIKKKKTKTKTKLMWLDNKGIHILFARIERMRLIRVIKRKINE